MSNFSFPARIFATGHEPVGERVNSYQKSKAVKAILNALDHEEAKRLQDSQLGKLLATMEQPSFSGSFGFYMLSRLLRVKKKHELWFLFAGRPIRFSLREFVLVTGLECGKIAQKKKKKNLVSQKPYWPELFGLLKSCTVDSVVMMLQKKKISDKEKRFKCACLAVTAAVLVPTSHITKIIPEHVELIRDIDEFLSYPWGRVGFDLLVSSIKSKDELELSQKTIAVKGFFYAVQLVLMAAVPSLTEVVQPPFGESDSDVEDEIGSGDDGNNDVDEAIMPQGTATPVAVKMTLSPSHARELDEDEKVADDTVEVLVKLIGEGFRFTKDMFTGGLSSTDLTRMRMEKAQKEKEAKDKKKKDKSAESSAPVVHLELDSIADLVADKLKVELQSFNNRLKDLEPAVLMQDTKFPEVISGSLNFLQNAVIESINGYLNRRDATRGSDKPVHFNSPHSPPNIRSGVETKVDNPPVSVTPIVLGFSPSKPKSVSQPLVPTFNHLPKPTPLAMSDDEFLRSLTQSINSQANDPSRIGGDKPINPSVYSPSNPMMTSKALGGETTQPVEQCGLKQSVLNSLPDDMLRGNTKAMDLLISVSPSFSLGFTQEDKREELEHHDLNVKATMGEEDGPHKSKRLKTTSVVYKDYHCGFNRPNSIKPPFSMMCDPSVNYGMRFTELKSKLLQDSRPVEVYEGASVATKDVVDIGERVRVMLPTVLDPLMYYLRQHCGPQMYPQNYMKIDFFDTNFPILIKSQYAKFTKTAMKDRSKFKFSATLMHYFTPENPQRSSPESVYFPFNFDQRHWVGVCVDITNASILVLDCNVAFRTDNALKRDFAPIANLFPFLVRAATTKAL
ncbi:uncharacterized protein LOC112088838 [Eutrema salsugineum]|uniref:uncharacterized protein LOC112088838 n=1 Tax=Eutrema salsugineum TaxID=72664 RepID=UPI000CED7064|nr:uncharacterized protein LOC112088838 [Eutrema salsugineum]